MTSAAIRIRQEKGAVPPTIWSPGTVLAAGCLTAALFLLVPYLERLAQPRLERLELRTVNPVRLPPPVRAPENLLENRAESRPVPRPRLQQAAAQKIPVRASLMLELVIGDVRGDFDLDFDIGTAGLVEELGAMVFELEQVDGPPVPLVRLRPVYPPVARMRRTEGHVEVEFVVLADGTTTDMTVLSSRPGEVFVYSALRAIRQWRFQPATHRGKTVPVRVRQKVSFLIEEDSP